LIETENFGVYDLVISRKTVIIFIPSILVLSRKLFFIPLIFDLWLNFQSFHKPFKQSLTNTALNKQNLPLTNDAPHAFCTAKAFFNNNAIHICYHHPVNVWFSPLSQRVREKEKQLLNPSQKCCAT
jgi:hypothetical protein